MPITTLIVMYATSQISSYLYAAYFSAGMLLGVGFTFGAVYFNQQAQTENRELEIRKALNDVVSLIMNPCTLAVDFEKKLCVYQHLFESQTLAYFRQDYQMRHEQKSFTPTPNSAFSRITPVVRF